ncbi:hypothetical protein G3I24_27460 [Micromonospora aurantiaca]|nr:hypothetical protein [Micromonospora aurantiaca]
MAHRLKTIAVSRLLLDQSNARLGDEQPSQQAAQLALAQLLGPQLLEIAQDIVDRGLDPTTLIAVTPEGAPPGRFRVIEGNRRLLALRALDTPAIVDPAFSTVRRKKFASLAATFRADPIASVSCVVFDAEEEARHWIVLRHTGANGGVGLVEWDTNEQDRYKSRHGDVTDRREAGQIIDFVSKVRPPRPGDKRIFTTLQRVIATPVVREKLGIGISGGKVYSYFPGHEVVKGLGAVVEDLRTGHVKVKDVYYEEERVEYVGGFGLEKLPDPQTRLPEPVLLSALSPSPPAAAGTVPAPRQGEPPVDYPGSSADTDVATGESGGGGQADDGSGDVDGESRAPATGGSSPNPQLALGGSAAQPLTRPSRVKPPRPRATTIPKSCVLWIKQPRINAIYIELTRLEVEQFVNACAVLLRVFLELSVDHHIDLHSVMSEEQRRSTPLAKRLKELAAHLRGLGVLSEQLEKAVIKVADGKGLLGTSTVTFNQYVHNQYAYPSPSELRNAWDELQPMMTALWTK